jgi:hypothetical protein
MRSIALTAAALATILVIGDGAPASAQVNCNAAPHGPARARCYGQLSQMWAEQSRNYNNIARDQYRQHQQIGRVLGRAPLVGRYAGPAWNAPRAAYQLRYGRP